MDSGKAYSATESEPLALCPPATEFLRYSLLILTFQKLCPQKANGIFCNSSRTRFAPLRVLGRSRSQQYTGLLLCTARPSRPKRSPNIEKQQTQ